MGMRVHWLLYSLIPFTRQTGARNSRCFIRKGGLLFLERCYPRPTFHLAWAHEAVGDALVKHCPVMAATHFKTL